jgi:ubiquinone/menaquinone biosynthesis C-methylase UbiE
MSRAAGGGFEPAIGDWSEAGAAYWDEIYADAGIDGAVYRLRETRALALFETLGLPADARVLELGPGAGRVAVVLAGRGHRVVCVDPSEAMLRRSADRARAEGVGNRVETVVADAQALPFPDASFAAALAVGVLPWLERPEAGLAEMRRVLAPGGSVVLTSDNRGRLAFVLDPRLNPIAVEAAKRADDLLVRRLGTRSHRRREHLPRRYSNRAVDRMLAQAGLVKRTATSVGFGPFSFLRRPVLPAGLAGPAHERLQLLADRGVPGLRGAGAHYVVVADRPRSRSARRSAERAA